MNKTIATIAIAGTAILSPIVGMGIGETRSLLLDLAPEEQITTLADKIDESRVNNDQKLAESDQKLTSLQQELDSAKQTIAEQKVALDKQVVKNDTTVSKLAEQSRCAQLNAEQPICQQDSRYQTKAAFDKMLSELEISSDGKKMRTKIFNKCQEIIAACN